MAYTTKIEFFKGVPFTPSLDHTLYPTALSTKNGWLETNYGFSPQAIFNNIQIIKYNSSTGQGTVRLEVSGAVANEANYCCVVDNQGKTYFAFVHGCQYINDGKTNPIFDIFISIDPLMTYLISADDSFKQCSIARHSFTKEGAGAEFKNAINEQVPFGTGEIYEHDEGDYWWDGTNGDQVNLNDCVTVIGVVNNAGTVSCYYTANIPQALLYLYYPTYACANALIDFVLNHLDDPEQLKAIWLVPRDGMNVPADWTATEFTTLDNANFFTSPRRCRAFNPNAFRNFYSQGEESSYNARHIKTTLYPYHYGRLYGENGDFMDLKFEEWNAGELAEQKGYFVDFDVNSTPPAIVKFGPYAYGGTDARKKCKSLQIGGYPQGSVSIDNWYTWHAQNEHSLNMSYYNKTLTALTGAAMSGGDPGKMVGSGLDLIGTAVSNTAKKADLETQADAIIGSTNTSWLEYSFGEKNPRRSICSVSKEVAERIDKYFDRFGYNQGGKVTTPKPLSDLAWTYIQTNEPALNIKSCPCNTNEANAINNALMKGVTFWNNGSVDASTIMTYPALPATI